MMYTYLNIHIYINIYTVLQYEPHHMIPGPTQMPTRLRSLESFV